jgi:undecaprenyl-diphosphatase
VVSLQESLIAGILQGVLEWLPISSEGNLVILLSGLLGLEHSEVLSFVIFLHLGTGIAALIYFREEVISILSMRTEQDKIILFKLVLITLLTGLIGFPIFIFLSLSPLVGEVFLGLTGIALIFTGLIQKNSENKGLRRIQELSWYEAVGLGIVQGLSIIPGLSRSGVTTSLLLFRNYEGEDTFRFSFLMSIPASFAAGLGMMVIRDFSVSTEAFLSLISSAIVGYISIGVLIKIAERIRFWKICIMLGIIAIIVFLPTFLHLL